LIDSIRLQHFRSYHDDSFEFDPGVNIIVGPNASGKTNLLEAVLVACVGASYRVRDIELIRHNQPWARLDTRSEHGTRTVKLETSDTGRAKKTIIIDNKPYLRLPLHKIVPVVLFEPNHLQLMHGSPELRRDFLDNLLEQTKAGFGVLRRQYKRTLAQRNALLKQDKQTAGQQLFAWNIRLSELGGQIAEARLQLIATINERLPELYKRLSKAKDDIRIHYNGTSDIEQYGSRLLQKLDKSIELDFQRGFTAYGPHRDDIGIDLGGYPASDAASRGEIRTIVLGLKIIELQLLEAAHDKKPLLLLDDVFSELDGSRRLALTEYLKGHQTFITTTDADVVVQHFMDKCHIIPLTLNTTGR
jgi:DNA replication and repair protein RecF